MRDVDVSITEAGGAGAGPGRGVHRLRTAGLAWQYGLADVSQQDGVWLETFSHHEAVGPLVVETDLALLTLDLLAGRAWVVVRTVLNLLREQTAATETNHGRGRT